MGHANKSTPCLSESQMELGMIHFIWKPQYTQGWMGTEAF